MGHVCYQCLPMKIIVYCQEAKDFTVSVKREANLGKCDICRNNEASFIVSYISKSYNNTTGNSGCIVCTCGSGTTNVCPLHKTYYFDTTGPAPQYIPPITIQNI